MTNLDYLYNPDAVKDNFDRNYFVDKKLGFSVIERGTVLPHKTISANDVRRRIWGAGGIVDSRGEYIRSTFAVSNNGEPYTTPPPLYPAQLGNGRLSRNVLSRLGARYN